MANDFKQLYKIQKSTLEDISKALCEVRGLPYHKISEVTLYQHIKQLENLYQTVPNSMLSDNIVFVSRYLDTFNNSYYFEANNEQIEILESNGYVPGLISAETSNRPVFAYPLSNNESYFFLGRTGVPYYIGNYIT
jgi:hypothetical protein